MSVRKSGGTSVRDSRIKGAANGLPYCIYQRPSSAGRGCIMASCAEFVTRGFYTTPLLFHEQREAAASRPPVRLNVRESARNQPRCVKPTMMYNE